MKETLEKKIEQLEQKIEDCTHKMEVLADDIVHFIVVLNTVIRQTVKENSPEAPYISEVSKKRYGDVMREMPLDKTEPPLWGFKEMLKKKAKQLNPTIIMKMMVVVSTRYYPIIKAVKMGTATTFDRRLNAELIGVLDMLIDEKKNHRARWNKYILDIGGEPELIRHDSWAEYVNQLIEIKEGEGNAYKKTPLEKRIEAAKEARRERWLEE